MQAICVTPARDLEVRTLERPQVAAPGHVLVDMDASAINHGDKTFLKMPGAAGLALATSRADVWGASGAGRVVAIGAGVPQRYLGRQVAIYRSLGRSPDSLGLWCERAEMPFTNCLVLPEHVQARDYSGSLVNAVTAHAFLEEAAATGHRAVVATAGNAATGHALAALARRRGMPAILLVRSEAARSALQAQGIEHVVVTDAGFADRFAPLAAALGATAVFDGVGGALLGQVAGSLPPHATVYCYGFMGGPVPMAIPSVLLMAKDLTLRRFSNFDSPTVKEHDPLVAALAYLETVIDDPLFATRIGRSFRYDEIEGAMAYAPADGAKAILVA